MKTTYFDDDDTLVIHLSDKPIVREVSQDWEPVGLGDRRLRNDHSGPFLASPLSENTGFLSHSWAGDREFKHPFPTRVSCGHGT